MNKLTLNDIGRHVIHKDGDVHTVSSVVELFGFQLLRLKTLQGKPRWVQPKSIIQRTRKIKKG